MFMGGRQCEERLINQENDLLVPFPFHLSNETAVQSVSKQYV